MARQHFWNPHGCSVEFYGFFVAKHASSSQARLRTRGRLKRLANQNSCTSNVTHEAKHFLSLPHEVLTIVLVGGLVSALALIGLAIFLGYRHGRRPGKNSSRKERQARKGRRRRGLPVPSKPS